MRNRCSHCCWPTNKKKTFIVLSKKERFKKRLKCPELIVQLVSVVFKSQIMANPKLGGEEGLGGRLSWLCKLRWRGCGRCLPANSRWQMTFRLSVAVWGSLLMIENYIYGIKNQFNFVKIWEIQITNKRLKLLNLQHFQNNRKTNKSTTITKCWNREQIAACLCMMN